MIVKFKKPVYQTIWTGTVDQILSYNINTHKFTVKDIESGETRTHMTNLNALNLSISEKPYSKTYPKLVVHYMLTRGLPTYTIDNLDRL